jgi:ribosomal protein S18 acetylase RimI-like enzyme
MGITILGPTTSVDDLDRLEPLWRSLHRHHLAVASYSPLVHDADASWVRRRRWYVDLLSDGGCYFVAEEEGAPVGYAFVRATPGPDDTFDAPNGMLELVSLVVDEGRRHQGVGTRLLESVIAQAGRRGIDTLQVAVMAGNESASRFYREAGFSTGEEILYRNLRGS